MGSTQGYWINVFPTGELFNCLFLFHFFSDHYSHYFISVEWGEYCHLFFIFYFFFCWLYKFVKKRPCSFISLSSLFSFYFHYLILFFLGGDGNFPSHFYCGFCLYHFPTFPKSPSPCWLGSPFSLSLLPSLLLIPQPPSPPQPQQTTTTTTTGSMAMGGSLLLLSTFFLFHGSEHEVPGGIAVFSLAVYVSGFSVSWGPIPWYIRFIDSTSILQPT